MTIVKLSIIQAMLNINSVQNGSHSRVFRSKRIKARGSSLPCAVAEFLVLPFLGGVQLSVTIVSLDRRAARAHQFVLILIVHRLSSTAGRTH